MIINQPVYLEFGRTDPKVTFLRFTNIVHTLQEAKYLVMNAYTFTDHDNKLDFYEKILAEYKNIKLLVDCSTEMLTSDLKHFTESLYADRILIVSNGVASKTPGIHLSNSKVKHIKEDFFIKYYHYYCPELIQNIGVKPNEYLLLTGKPKIEREALLSKLYKKDLLKYGNISYFGKEKRSDFNNPMHIGVREYFDFLKPDIQRFKDSLGSNMVLDQKEWSFDPSHTRYYNGVLYKEVDFIVVCESDFNQHAIFHTEKSTKPIQLNKKFILLNNTGALADLKEKFLKYHGRDISELTDWVDTSYDSIEDLNERMDCIVNLIAKKTQNKKII